MRADCGANIAPVKNRATGLIGEIALKLEESVADLAVDGDPRGKLAGRTAAQLPVGKTRRLDGCRDLARRFAIVEIEAALGQFSAGCTI